MALTQAYNQVTFTPDDERGAVLQLTLSGPFTIGTGLRASVTTATVPFHEYDKLDGRPIRRGTLAFWWSKAAGGGTPDVAYRGVKIVDVMPGELGVPRGQNVARVVDYTLMISDLRERIVPPRGGRVNLGLVEPSLPPLVWRDATDTQPPPPKNPVQLMAECMRPSGLLYEIIDFQFAMRNSGVPENLQWFNAWAPVELQKLLDHASGVFCPQTNGSVLIRNIGHGEDVIVPVARRLAVASVPEADRRGKIVIFTSAPNPVIETQEIRGPSPDTWEFVIQDVKGAWRRIDDPELRQNPHSLIQQGGPETTVRGNYVVTNQKYRDHVRRQLYHCIRLSEKFTKGAKRILRQQVTPLVITPDQPPKMVVKDVEVSAVRAVLDGNTNLWSTSAEPVACTATYLEARSNVIYVHELLGKLETGDGLPTQVPFLEKSFKALADGDLRVRLSLESAVELAGQPGRYAPEYYNIGFRRGPSELLSELAPAALQAELETPGDETVIISRPDLRLVREKPVDGSDPTDNGAQLAGKALKLALRYLAERQVPQVIKVKGFFKVELSGTVSEVQLDQGGDGDDGPTTTIKLHSHWTPLGPEQVLRLGRRPAGAAGGAEAFPEQLETMGEHMSLGAATSPQPLVPLQPAPAPRQGAPMFPVQVTKDGGEQGSLSTRASWTYRVNTLSGAKIGDKVILARRRPLGQLEAGQGVGIAFFDGEGNLKLIEAGEVLLTKKEC